VSDRQQVEVEEREELVGRVAAIDVAKASGVVCTRVPHATRAGQRTTTVWQVGSTTNQILELAEQLASEGIQRVVVESTSDYWRPFVFADVLRDARPQGGLWAPRAPGDVRLASLAGPVRRAAAARWCRCSGRAVTWRERPLLPPCNRC
jgi:hypothetical protein